MRISNACSVALALTLALTACGGDDDESAATPEDDTTSVTSDGDGDDGGGWTEDDLQRLVETEIDEFTIEGSTVNEFGSATVSYHQANADGPVPLVATVTLTACDAFLCFDVAAEPDDQQLENVRSNLSAVHADNPDLVEEIGPTELAGRDAFAFYFRSYVESDGGVATVNSYTATVHDGANLVSVRVGPDPAFGADSPEDLEAQMDAERGAEVAEVVLEAFGAELS